MLYPNLSVRIKKSTRFSLFFALKTAGFSAFFLPLRQESTVETASFSAFSQLEHLWSKKEINIGA
jgi:hypothetical protein